MDVTTGRCGTAMLRPYVALAIGQRSRGRAGCYYWKSYRLLLLEEVFEGLAGVVVARGGRR
jgi:hypothetical protein